MNKQQRFGLAVLIIMVVVSELVAGPIQPVVAATLAFVTLLSGALFVFSGD